MIAEDIKNENFYRRGYPTNMFVDFRMQLELIVPVEIFRLIEETYKSIRDTKSRHNVRDWIKKSHEDALALIDKVLSMLT